MGDRVSISFVNPNCGEYAESVALFSHWGGMSFVDFAHEYAKNLKSWISETYDRPEAQPLSRMEPDTVMVDFIRHLTESKERVTHNYYLGKTELDGDNSNNGHHKIYLATKEVSVE